MKKIVLFVIAILLVTANTWAMDFSNDSTTFTREDIKIFPSPCNGLFNIKVNSPNETFTIVVYDILGKEIYRNWGLASGKKYTIDLRYEPILKAIYFAAFTNSQGEKVVKKIVIQPGD